MGVTAMLVENEWDFRTARGPRHGERIPFAGLNRNLAAKLEVELRSPSAGRDDESIGAHFSHVSLNGARLIATSSEAVKITLFVNVRSSFDQELSPGGHELVGSQMGVALVVEAAG
jgi:hypothetical protein